MQPQQPLPDQTAMTDRRAYGMHCPVCHTFIPVNMAELLHQDALGCPVCGLRLVINKTQSKRALEALAKVEYAMQQVKKTETFHR